MYLRKKVNDKTFYPMVGVFYPMVDVIAVRY